LGGVKERRRAPGGAWGGARLTVVRIGLALAVVVVVAGCETARPADPEAVCPSDPKKAESLGCGVFRALAGENEAAYVALVMTARADVEEARSLMDHPGALALPGQGEEERAREEAADEFHIVLEELKVNGIAPVSLQLQKIDASRAAVRGKLGFAEEISVHATAGKRRVTITLDDCFLVRGRWLVSDGLRLDGHRTGR
jgi:hypothetical protein